MPGRDAGNRFARCGQPGTHGPTAGGKRWTHGELILGIAQHDAYHVGQIVYAAKADLDKGWTEPLVPGQPAEAEDAQRHDRVLDPRLERDRQHTLDHDVIVDDEDVPHACSRLPLI